MSFLEENAAERVDDGDEALYGGVGKAVALTEQEEKGPNEAKGSDEEDDDDEIAIVLNDSKPAARATLRFTHGRLDIDCISDSHVGI